VPVTKTIVYDDWSKGEFGTMNPAKAPNGSWTGTNVVAYRNNRIGPRPGLKEVTPSTSPSKNGPLLGLGFSPVAQTHNRPIFFILEDRVYAFDPTDATTLQSATPDLTVAPTDTDSQVVLSKESCRLIGDEVYFTIDNDSAYRLNLRTTAASGAGSQPVLTRITDSDPEGAGTDIELHRDRMFVCNGGVRVFYSDAATFGTWGAGSFFDVGAAYRIISMLSFRDALVFFTQSGVWAMTGSSPADGTFRRVAESLSPLDKGAIITNDSIIYIPASRNAPVIFNGSFGDEESLLHLDAWKTTSSAAYGVQSYGNRDVLFLSGTNGDLLWRKEGAWTVHDLEVSAGPWITRYFDDNVLIAYEGTSSVDPKFYMLAMNLDRPAFTSDTWAQPGDDSTTPLTASFTLPDYQAPEGKEVRVRSVTVDYVKYRTGSATTNNIDMSVTTMFRENLPGTADSAESPRTIFNEAGTATAAGTSGTTARAVARGFAGGFGGSYRLSFSDLRGVAIDRVVVEIEEMDAPVV